jgi:cystathionine beta-lyase
MDYSHDWSIEKEWISPIPSILAGLNFAVEVLTKKGDGVIVQPPIYPPFFNAVKKQGRKLLENELKIIDENYEIDFEDFEQKAKEAKLFLFCSPHNPTGRVWSRDELEKIAKICKKEKVTIISDEVHADLVYKDKHIPIATIKDAKDITITLNAPSKSFNVASIVNAYTIIENSSLRRRFLEIFSRYSLINQNPLSIVTTIAAYKNSDEWLKELKIYLQDNLAYIKQRLEKIPKIKAMPTESTFLLWLDCSGLNLRDKELENFFVYDAKLGLNTGISFGKGGEGFMRLNFAVSRSMLVDAMDRLEKLRVLKIS